MIGPTVPDDIQKARDIRLGRNLHTVLGSQDDDSVEVLEREVVPEKLEADINDDQSSSEDEFGPALPSNTSNNENEEKEALERLAKDHSGEIAAKKPTGSAERANWMDFALSTGKTSANSRSETKKLNEKPKILRNDGPVLTKNPSTTRSNDLGPAANARQSLSNRFSKAE